MGGPNLPRASRTAHPCYQARLETGEPIDRDTGEILPLPETRYGDLPMAKLEGISVGGQFHRTKKHTWRRRTDGAGGGGVQFSGACNASEGPENFTPPPRALQARHKAPQALSDLCE